MTKPGSMRFAESYVIDRPGVVATVRLAKDQRLVIFARGNAPVIGPMIEPGLYEIDCAAMKPGLQWPVLLSVVPAKHAPLFEKLTIEEVAGIMDQTLVAIGATKH